MAGHIDFPDFHSIAKSSSIMKRKTEKNDESMSLSRPASNRFQSCARGIWGYFTAPYTSAKGIETWKSWSFWIVLACYLASFWVMAHDPFFQERYHFRLRCIFPFLIAFFLTASINWESLLTGAPRGVNLLLHVMMLPPATLLFTRMLLATDTPMAEESSSWFLKKILGTLVGPILDLAKELNAKLPTLLKDTFAHPWLALLLILFLAILSIRNRNLKISAIICILMTLLGGLLTSDGNLSFALLALLLFGTGLCLQWNPYHKLAYHINVCNRLGKMRKQEDGRFTESVLSVMDKLYNSSGMDSHRILHITKGIYAPNGEFSDNELKQISGEITRRMVEDLELVSLEMTGNRITILPLPQIYHCNEILENTTSFARLGAVVAISIMWTVVPFDVLPDFIPCVGLLDDLAVDAMAVLIGRNCLKQQSKKLV